MPWTTPTGRTTGYTPNATDWNIVQADLVYLYGDIVWTAVTAFTGTWTAGSVAPRFMLVGRTVHLQGYISGGTINTAAFTLPAGFWPTERLTFPSSAGGTFAELMITETGVVTPQIGKTTDFSVGCIYCTG